MYDCGIEMVPNSRLHGEMQEVRKLSDMKNELIKV